jgi:hypothetical protein
MVQYRPLARTVNCFLKRKPRAPEVFDWGQYRLGICHVLAIVGVGSYGLPPILGQLVVAFNLLCRFLACRGRRSFQCHEGVIVVAGGGTVKASVVGSLRRVVQLHWTVVIIAEIAIVDHCVVCINRILWGQLLLVGRVLGTVGPWVLCWFVREGVDGAGYLAVALGLFIAWLFRLIVATVVPPVAIAGSLNTRALCHLTFVIVSAIAVAIAVDVPTLLLEIAIRAASGVAWSNLALFLISTTVILVCANLITKLIFELEMITFLDTLELHALKRIIVLVHSELGFKELVVLLTDSKISSETVLCPILWGINYHIFMPVRLDEISNSIVDTRLKFV